MSLLPAMNRLSYDESAYHQELKQSMLPGQYAMSQYAANHCGKCVSGDAAMPDVGSGSVPSCNNVSEIDVESELRNITRPATRAPAGKYRGNGGPPTMCGGVPVNQASRAQTNAPTCGMPAAVDSRLTAPSCTLRGTGWNRFEWLCRDPQDQAMVPFDFLVNTAIVMKDNHRPQLCHPLDPTLALPPSASRCIKPINALTIPCNQNGGARAGPDGEPPIMSYRTCREIDRSRYGA